MAEESDFTPNLNLEKPAHGSYEGQWEIPVNANSDAVDALFGADSGHSHTGEPGSGPRVKHTELDPATIGTNTHDEIDDHIADTALHTDEKIGVVSGLDSNEDPITITSVGELQFVNAALTDAGGGVVVVTSSVVGTTGGSSNLFSKPESAAVAYTDNFTYAPGTLLNATSWGTILSNTASHDWIIDGSVVGDSAVIRTVAADDNAIQTGYAALQCLGHVPRGSAQRVAVKVDYLRPYEENGQAVSGQAAFDAMGADKLALSLDLLSVFEGYNRVRPVKMGLSMLISKAADASTLTYTLSVSSDFDAQAITSWTDIIGPSGTAMPYSAIEGWHELALRRHPTISGAFYVHYYYNEGLFWYKLFNPESTDIAEVAVAEAINRLISNLGEAGATLNDTPRYGRIGLSFGYQLESIATQLKYGLKIKHISINSQDDDEQPKTVVTPVFSTGLNQTQVCASGPFSDVYTDDPFVFSDVGTWTVQDLFASDSLVYPSTSGAFTVLSSNNDLRVLYCHSPSPTPNDFSSYRNTIVSNVTTAQSIVLSGDDIPMGSMADGSYSVRVLAHSDNIIKDWDTNTYFAQEAFTAGDELPSSFIDIVSVESEADTSGLHQQIRFTYTTGERLPLGESVDIEITPKSEPSFLATWGPITITPNAEEILGATTLTWENGEWVDATPDSLPAFDDKTILEGSTVLCGVSVNNLLMTNGFNSTAGFISNTGTVLTTDDLEMIWPTSQIPYSKPVKNGPNNSQLYNQGHLVKYYDQILPFGVKSDIALLTTESLTVPPPTTENSNPPVISHIGDLRFDDVSATNNESIVQIWRLSDCLWARGQSQTQSGSAINMLFSDAYFRNGNEVTGNLSILGAPVKLIEWSQIYPRNPEVIYHAIDSTQEGDSVTIDLVVQYHHDFVLTNDLTVEAISGFTGPITISARYFGDETNTTDLTTTDPNALRHLVCTGTLDNAGASIVLRVTKTAAAAWITANSTDARVVANPSITGVSDDIYFGVVLAAPPATLTLSRNTTVNSQIEENAFTDVYFWVTNGTDLSGYSTGDLIQTGLSGTFTLDVPNYLKTAVLPQIYKAADDGPISSKGIYIRVFCGPSGGGPATFSLANNNGTPDTEDIVVVPLDTLTIDSGGLSADYSAHTWGLHTNNQKTVYLHVSGVSAATTFTWTINTAQTAVSITPITTTINVATEVVTAELLLSGNAAHNDTLKVTASRPFTYYPGDTSTATLDGSMSSFVTFSRPTVAGPPLANATVFPILASGGINHVTVTTLTQSIFVTPPLGGRYFQFHIPGGFDMTGITYSSVTGYDLTQVRARYSVDFVDKDSIGTPVTDTITPVITAGTPSSLSGYAILGGYGPIIAAKITNADTAQVYYYYPATQYYNLYTIKRAARPIINDGLKIIEGASSQTITITGSGLTPPPGPGTDVVWGYAYTETSAGTVTAWTIDEYAEDHLTVTLSVDAATAGELIGLEISDMLGERTTNPSVVTVIADDTETPSVTSVLLYRPEAQAYVDANVSIPSNLATVYTGTNTNARIAVDGTGLSTTNVSSAYLTICGEDSVDFKTPPAVGWHPQYTSDNRIRPVSLVSQSATRLVFEFSSDVTLSNARVKLFLLNALGSPLSPSPIDGTGQGSVGSLTHFGLTARYGPPSYEAIDVNFDPRNGPTPYDISHQAIENTSYGSVPPGSGFSFDLLLNTARELRASDFTIIPGPSGSTGFIDNITSTDAGAGLAWAIDVGLFQNGNMIAGDCIGIRLKSGQPLLNFVVGNADWGNDTNDVSF